MNIVQLYLRYMLEWRLLVVTSLVKCSDLDIQINTYVYQSREAPDSTSEHIECRLK